MSEPSSPLDLPYGVVGPPQYLVLKLALGSYISLQGLAQGFPAIAVDCRGSQGFPKQVCRKHNTGHDPIYKAFEVPEAEYSLH